MANALIDNKGIGLVHQGEAAEINSLRSTSRATERQLRSTVAPGISTSPKNHHGRRRLMDLLVHPIESNATNSLRKDDAAGKAIEFGT
jgi:hypothetical protein